MISKYILDVYCKLFFVNTPRILDDFGGLLVTLMPASEIATCQILNYEEIIINQINEWIIWIRTRNAVNSKAGNKIKFDLKFRYGPLNVLQMRSSKPTAREILIIFKTSLGPTHKSRNAVFLYEFEPFL